MTLKATPCDCAEYRRLESACRDLLAENADLRRRLERWQKNETQIGTNRQVKRLLAERDRLRETVAKLDADLAKRPCQLDRCIKHGQLQAERDALQADADQYRWHSFDDRWPEADEIVQQYLGQAVFEQSNPPEWAFPVRRWRGQESLDNSATHWRYVRGPFG